MDPHRFQHTGFGENLGLRHADVAGRQSNEKSYKIKWLRHCRVAVEGVKGAKKRNMMRRVGCYSRLD